MNFKRLKDRIESIEVETVYGKKGHLVYYTNCKEDALRKYEAEKGISLKTNDVIIYIKLKKGSLI